MGNKILKSWQEQAEDALALQSVERHACDAKRIDDITAILKSLPTGKLIMDWAEDRGVSIWLDYQCKDSAGGYHIIGSKTVCLSANLTDLQLVPILAHELRHAWQDEQNFMPSLYKNAKTYLKQIRFIEADATAYEFQIFTEMQEAKINVVASPYYRFCQNILKQSLDNTPQFLKGKEAFWSGFCGFFADRNKKDNYDSTAILVGEILAELKKAEIFKIKTEYSNGNYSKPNIKGIDVESKLEIVKIANMFGEGNYLDSIEIDFTNNEQFVGNISKSNRDRLKKLCIIEGNGYNIQRQIPNII